MKQIFTQWALILVLVATVLNTNYGQNIQTDALVQMPMHQFEDWLIEQNKNETLDWNQLSVIVCERLKNRDGIPSQTLVEILTTSILPSATKIAFIDNVLPYTSNDRYLTLDLYVIKSAYLNCQFLQNDSLRQAFSLKINPILENEAIRFAKIIYSNYVRIGDRYLSTGDTLRAIDYYIKGSKFPFYLLRNSDDMEDFKSIYVHASIGRIKACQGNYPKLRELRFVPAAYDRILPTYKSYIEWAGGRCAECDDYYKNDPIMRNFKSVPPIQDKN